VPEIIQHCFVGGGYDNSPVSIDLCDDPKEYNDV
jgi:hypothetical protein